MNITPELKAAFDAARAAADAAWEVAEATNADAAWQVWADCEEIAAAKWTVIQKGVTQ